MTNEIQTKLRRFLVRIFSRRGLQIWIHENYPDIVPRLPSEDAPLETQAFELVGALVREGHENEAIARALILAKPNHRQEIESILGVQDELAITPLPKEQLRPDRRPTTISNRNPWTVAMVAWCVTSMVSVVFGDLGGCGAAQVHWHSTAHTAAAPGQESGGATSIIFRREREEAERRAEYARLLRTLAELPQPPNVVAFDMEFPSINPNATEVFAQAIRAARDNGIVVVLGADQWDASGGGSLQVDGRLREALFDDMPDKPYGHLASVCVSRQGGRVTGVAVKHEIAASSASSVLGLAVTVDYLRTHRLVRPNSFDTDRLATGFDMEFPSSTEHPGCRLAALGRTQYRSIRLPSLPLDNTINAEALLGSSSSRREHPDLAGRVVVVADLRYGSTDFHRDFYQRTGLVEGFRYHVAAINILSDGGSRSGTLRIRPMRQEAEHGVWLLLAIVGVFVATRVHTPVVGVVVSIGLAIAIYAGSLYLFKLHFPLHYGVASASLASILTKNGPRDLSFSWKS